MGTRTIEGSHALLSGSVRRVRRRVEGGALGAPETDLVAVEEPLEIRLDGEPLAVTMRTPGHDARLVLGFLFAEGVVESAEEVASVLPCGRPDARGQTHVADVHLLGVPRVERVLDARRWTVTSSACGLCGRQGIDDLLARCGALPTEPRVEARRILEAMELLATSQPVFRQTGGLHAAVAIDRTGRRLAGAEDVGRHNAVDKVVGALLLDRRVGARSQGEPPAVLAVSGRASFEIVQKAAVARIPVVASVSAASSRAVDLAEEVGVTLAAFARGARFGVYTHAGRLAGFAGDAASGSER